MAKDRVATISGTFLKPVVSKNGRYYSPKAIEGAVGRMQKKIAGGAGLPLTMFTSHREADADSALSTVGRITNVGLNPDGSATFEADIADTAKGRDLAALVTPQNPYVKGVSIRGRWLTDPEPVTIEGKEAVGSDDLEIEGIDWTGRPGIDGAEITSAMLAEAANHSGGRGIFESFDEPVFFDGLTEAEEVTEDEPEEAEETADIHEALAVLADYLAEGGNAPGNGKKPYGNVTYADPGYQKDKKKRYPIDTANHVRAAWAFINKDKNAGLYTSSQVSAIKGRIKRAAKKFKIDIASEAEQLTQDIAAVLEAYACTTINNGTGRITVSGYTDDAGKLIPMAQRIALAAIAGLTALDPDADGDIDLTMPDGSSDSSSSHLPPANGESVGPASTDDTMSPVTTCDCGTAIASTVTVCPTCGKPIIQATSAPNQDTEAQVADETQTNDAPANESGAEQRNLTDADLKALAAILNQGIVAPESAPAEEAPVVEADAAADKKAKKAKKAEEAQAAAIATAVEEATDKLRRELQEEYRKNGVVTRTGLVESDAPGDLEGKTAQEIAHMGKKDFNKFAGEALMQVPALQRISERAMERAGGFVIE